MLYLEISLDGFEENFYLQNDGSVMKLCITAVTITRVILRNKEGVIIKIRVHKKVFKVRCWTS